MFAPIFLWVEKYGVLDRVGINLSPEHIFEVSIEENRINLEYRSNEDYRANIYGDNLDIIALVGENGTGKTTIADAIGDYFFTNTILNLDRRMLRVVANNGKLEVQFFLELFDDTELVFLPDEDAAGRFVKSGDKWYETFEISGYGGNTQVKPSLTNVAGFYFSNVFDTRYSYSPNGLKDVSTNGILRDICDNAPVNVGYDLVTQFFWKEFQLQLDFATYLADHENFDFPFPSAVYVEFPDFNDEMEKIITTVERFTSSNLNYRDIIRNFMRCMERETYSSQYEDNLNTFSFIRAFSAAIRFAIIKGISFSNHYDEFTHDISIIQTEKANDQNDWEYTYAVLSKLHEETNREKYEQYLIFMRWLKDNQDDLKILFATYSTSMAVSQKNRVCLLFKDVFNPTNALFKTLYKEYRKTVDDYSYMYLCFSWAYPMSTGEQTLLTLFSRLYALEEDGILKPRYHGTAVSVGAPFSVTIILDEIDLSLHPKWQQTIIHDLVKYAPQFFDRTWHKVKIIITTHSPIILSDIPKQNTVLLQLDNGKVSVFSPKHRPETFAANISTLYYETFLLNRGSFGQFSSEYIERIIKRISPQKNPETKKKEYRKVSSTEYEELSKQISIIGEPIIRYKLFDMLDECYYSEVDGTRSVSKQESLLKQKMERAKREYDEFRNGVTQ